ncbi:MAG: STAS domain-containing protein [Nitrospinota bacterium]
MSISNQKRDNGVNIIRVQGKLLGDTLSDLSTTFDNLLVTDGSRVILNFKDVNIIDSGAVGFLVNIFNEFTKKGAQLKLCNVGASIRNLFKLADLEALFDIYDTEDKAVASLDIVRKS